MKNENIYKKKHSIIQNLIYIQWVYFVQLTSRIWAFIPDKIRQTEKSREGFEFSVKYG